MTTGLVFLLRRGRFCIFMHMDASLIPLIAGLGGAGVTARVALTTHILTGRREHKRWILDLKYQAYLKIVASMEQALQAVNDPDHLAQLVAKLTAAMEDINTAEIGLLSNNASMEAYARMIRAFNEYQPHITESREDQEKYREPVNRALFHCMQTFRKDLGIKGKIQYAYSPA